MFMMLLFMLKLMTVNIYLYSNIYNRYLRINYSSYIQYNFKFQINSKSFLIQPTIQPNSAGLVVSVRNDPAD